MKSAIALLALLTATAQAADWRPLETRDEARQRQSAENYETHRRNSPYGLPPSYDQPLGSPSVPGVERPGYAPASSGYQPPTPAYGGGGQYGNPYGQQRRGW